MDLVPDKLAGSWIMRLDLEKVRIYAKKADNRALLDRVTVFQHGMEPAAIEIIKKELIQRGFSQSDIKQHESVYKDLVICGPEGMPRLCKKCTLPAITSEWGWLKVFGFIPVIPWRFLYCEEHKTRL
ncbi:MAG: hypothetical protein EBT92_09155 [Planctomycetes bacterium]|nr:hypothetical protein [Planctomycetota bacterium]